MTKYIRLFSDLHLDFDVQNPFTPDQLWVPPSMPNDKLTTLVLAGDLWHAKKPLNYSNFSWLGRIASQFQYVIIVLGNHDLWGGNLNFEYKRMSDYAKKLGNVFVLQNSVLEIGEYKFLGTTLWTDFGGGKFLEESKAILNDYKYTRAGNNYAKLRPEIVLQEHVRARDFIEKNRSKKTGQKLWVITHHLPTDVSLDEVSEEDVYDYTNLEHLMGGVDVWVHGHNHVARDYTLSHDFGETQIICNPRGYPSQTTEYNPYLLK